MKFNTSIHRVARPGDIFLLLVPSAQELHRLQQWQQELQSRFGGRPVDHIHITSQRFTPIQREMEKSCIIQLNQALKTVHSFPVYTDELVQFFAPYWGTRVLRWRIQETAAYAAFRDYLDNVLLKIKCPSHFDRQRHATCTALNLDKEVDLELNSPGRTFPAKLFTARKLAVSQLVDENTFDILETIILK